MEKLRAVVFDLDGTLLDTLDDLMGATNAALAANGLPPRTREEVRRFVGNGIGKLVERAVPQGTAVAVTAQVLADFTAYYTRHDLDRTAPYAGVQEMLHALWQAGLSLAVVSNKLESAVENLRQHFFADTIAVAAGDCPDRPRKPAPESTLAALARLGVPPQQALFVGDSDVDIATAQNAGMPCLSVCWGFRDREFLLAHGAAVIVEQPQQAAEYILQQIG